MLTFKGGRKSVSLPLFPPLLSLLSHHSLGVGSPILWVRMSISECSSDCHFVMMVIFLPSIPPSSIFPSQMKSTWHHLLDNPLIGILTRYLTWNTIHVNLAIEAMMIHAINVLSVVWCFHPVFVLLPKYVYVGTQILRIYLYFFFPSPYWYLTRSGPK